METPEKQKPFASDVLHSQEHSRLSVEEIAKAVARHKREHSREGKDKRLPQKTAPRR